MFQFHSNKFSAPPAWQVDATSRQGNQDWSGEIGGQGTENRAMISYDDPNAKSAPARTSRGETTGMDMQNHLAPEVVEAPTTVGEAYLGSMKSILNSNKGNCILATFLVGTQNLVTWEGVLFDVGNDYLVIYQDDVDRYVLGDIYSLKFVQFFDSHGQPCASYRHEIPRNVRMW